jgi:adenine-specific DNA-methyltransferase
MSNKKLDMKSSNLLNDNIEFIYSRFPNCVTESASGKAIDFEKLKQELSADLLEGNKERYRLEWPGKREAIVTANLPTNKTLRPIKDDSVDFNTTENIYIEGDNLEVLKLLQESYLGKIKMIYIDPPYNTGNDFIYKDNFSKAKSDELFESGQKDELGQRLVVNPETSGRYHSDWLSMMYPRLKLARNLMSDDGIIFVSIGQSEISNLKEICDEIFGETNLVTICSRVMKTGGQKGAYFSPCVDYILVYAKNINDLSPIRAALSQNVIDKVYTKVETVGLKSGKKYRSMGLYQAGLDKRANQRYYIECPDGSFVIPPGTTMPDQKLEGSQVTPIDSDGVWRWTFNRFLKEKQNGNIEYILSDRTSLIDQNGKPAKYNIYYKIWLDDRLEDGQLPGNIIEKFENRHSSSELKELNIPFDFAKPVNLLKYLIALSGVKNKDLVLDFFSGSASTAHAALSLSAEMNERINFICIQLPEPTHPDSNEYSQGYKLVSEIGKERIRRAAKKIKEETNADIDYGFRVYRLDESNMQDVYYHPQDYDQSKMDMFADNVKTDRTADDLLAQIILDWGLPLNLKIEQANISGKQVYKVDDDSLYACFDSGLDENFAREIAKGKPLRVVFRDNSFKDNSAKTNVKQLLKQLSPETEMKVI